ncbi:MAG: DUF4268 domain-containing protein, partial [Kineothrix sp.]|nr:DUF4268 domain-containing protein [Kineothrix sp.]
IDFEERESPVGSFSVDLFATEEGTGMKIIIENQLEDTNHDHLGKIITYAAGKEASVIIWIVKRARDEHRQAVEWLNQHTDENIGFFLLEIELWKINGSVPAPRFNIVERPNDWAKAMKASEGLSDTKKTNLEYWEAFKKYAFSKDEFKKIFSERKAYPQGWYNLSVGNRHCHITLTATMTKNRLAAQIYISKNKDLYNHFFGQKAAIEEFLGEEITWHEASIDAVFGYDTYNADFNTDNWAKYFEWYCEKAMKLRDVVKMFAG